MNLDMLIVSLPVLDLQYPPSSPAVIKACVKAAGYRTHTKDLNLLLLDLCGSKEKFWQVQYNFENVGPQAVSSDDPVKVFFSQEHDLVRKWLDQSIEIIKGYHPRWLGISVFSYKSHKACLLLCTEIKRLNLPIKIVLGGRGVSSFALGPDHSQFKTRIANYFGSYTSKNFGEALLQLEICDKVIHGDGENAVVELLESDTPSSVQTRVEDIDLEAVPFVDFDDYDLKKYDYVNEPIIPITGSKGCVRKCTFCDIPVLWPKFRYRSGEHIAQEMIYLYHRHGVKKFYMTDSLVNGSMKAFMEFLTILSEHNRNNPEESIRWVGQYITRARSQQLDDRYYDLLKSSGGEGLTIGVESGSNAVKAHMKKQFSTADIDHELEQFDKRGIVCVLLFFSCYPTETWQDFLDTVNMFIRYQKYCASGTIYKITLGTPYTHHAQTPLWNMQESIGLSSKKGSDILWRLETNKDLTYYERIKRRLILQEVAVALGLPMSRNTAELNQLSDSIRNFRKEINEYFDETSQVELYSDIYDLSSHSQILMPPDMQKRIHEHLQLFPDMKNQIKQKHIHLNDDIRFDENSYLDLRHLITEPNENTA